jgi:hypothetical protein
MHQDVSGHGGIPHDGMSHACMHCESTPGWRGMESGYTGFECTRVCTQWCCTRCSTLAARGLPLDDECSLPCERLTPLPAPSPGPHPIPMPQVKPHAWDYGQRIMGFRGQDCGIMRFGAQYYGETRTAGSLSKSRRLIVD